MTRAIFEAGSAIDWPSVHRSIKNAVGEGMVGRRIAYHTYASRDAKAARREMRVEEVMNVRPRAAGHDRAFRGTDPEGQFIQVDWNRIVEIVVLDD